MHRDPAHRDPMHRDPALKAEWILSQRYRIQSSARWDTIRSNRLYPPSPPKPKPKPKPKHLQHKLGAKRPTDSAGAWCLPAQRVGGCMQRERWASWMAAQSVRTIAVAGDACPATTHPISDAAAMPTAICTARANGFRSGLEREGSVASHHTHRTHRTPRTRPPPILTTPQLINNPFHPPRRHRRRPTSALLYLQ